MKGFLVYLFGALGLGSILNGVAELTLPDPGGLQTPVVVLIAAGLWVPIHRWLTRHDPGPCTDAIDAPAFVAGPHGHHHRCTKRATEHAEHTCACGMSWQPNARLAEPSLISLPDRLTDEQFAEFETRWERAHRNGDTRPADQAAGKEPPNMDLKKPCQGQGCQQWTTLSCGRCLRSLCASDSAINLATMTHADGSTCLDPSNPARTA